MNGILIEGLSKEKSCEECYEKTHCFGTGSVDREGCIWCGLSKGYVGTNNLYDRCVVKDIKDCDGIINSSKLIEAGHLKETIDYYIREAGWDVKTNRVLGWVNEFIENEPAVYVGEFSKGEKKLVCQFDGNELKDAWIEG